MESKKAKSLIALLCALGILAVGHGISTENDIIFIIGLFLIVAGYLLIRKKLKGSLNDKL